MKKNFMRFVAMVSTMTLTLNTAVINVMAEGDQSEAVAMVEAATEESTIEESAIEEFAVEESSVEKSTELMEASSNETSVEQMVITGFADFDIVGNYQHISAKNKQSEMELVYGFPTQLEVYVNGSSKTESINVTWFCVGDNYQDDVYYYQFSPRWDEEKYLLADNINLLTDAPYIGVFADAENSRTGMSRMAGVYGTGYETEIFEYLVRDLGFNRAVACGIMANIYAESGFIPNNLQDTYEKSLGYTDSSYTAAVDKGTYTRFSADSAGYGLCQWSYSTRKANLLNYAKSTGSSIGDYKMQLEFMKNEFNSYASLKSTIASATNNADGAYNVGYRYCYSYEAPANKETKSVTRGNLARDKFWPYYMNYSISGSAVTVQKPEETKPSETTAQETVADSVEIKKTADGNLVAYKGGVVDNTVNGFIQFEGSWWYFENGKTSGTVNGLIKGTVDGKSAVWYCKNSKVDLNYNSLCKYDGGWWRCSKGQIDYTFSGLCEYSGKLFYCVNGKVNFGYNGLHEYNGKMVCCRSGEVDFTYTGLCKHNGSWYYCKNGVADPTYNSLCKYDGSWWYCKDGKVVFSYTGLCEYNGHYFYCCDGKVNFGYNSLCKYNGSWWCCRNGEVDFTYTGLCEYNGHYFYCVNSKVNFGYNSLCKYNGSWWCCRNGEVDFTYTGLCEYNGHYFYCVKNKVNFGYNSLCKYNDSWWCCRNGEVDFTYNGLCEYNGHYFYCVNSKVNFGYTGLCKYNGSWWYCKAGEVDFTYNGFCKYNGSWWYCKSSKVVSDFTGIVQATLSGVSGQWYVLNGEVKTSYTGTVNYNGRSYNVVNGKVVVSYSTVYASYTTTYKESQVNRSTNLKLACKAINGTVIPNGGTFSFNGIVGERTSAKGYKEAIVYEGGRETGGIGGGICQVATTIFNAALKANFKIVERHQHSLTVHYVPLGYDAAIAWGAKNLRWTNNSGTAIKIEATCASGKLSVRFLADKSFAPPAVTTKVTLSNHVYTLKRYVNGVCNYTTTSKYADK